MKFLSIGLIWIGYGIAMLGAGLSGHAGVVAVVGVFGAGCAVYISKDVALTISVTEQPKLIKNNERQTKAVSKIGYIVKK